MTIAIDTSPLQTEHSIRGVGFYLTNLKKELEGERTIYSYEFFTGKGLPDGADLVHFPYFDPYFFTLPLQKMKPTVVTVHDLTTVKFSQHFPPGIKGSIRWQIQKYALKQVDAIIADSISSKNDIVSITGIPESRVSVVYLAASKEFKHNLDEKKRKELLKKYSLPDKFVLYVGDATWNKNLLRLTEAIKEVDIPIVMAGKVLSQEDIDERNVWNKDLVAFQKQIKGDSRFSRLGFVPNEDLVTLYNTATLLVMPSLYEGFGLPVVEAMQSGCPVVTTRRGSLPEVGADAVYYVDPENATNIAEGIREVFLHKAVQDSLRQKGLHQAKKFSWEKTAKQTMQVYGSVLKNE